MIIMKTATIFVSGDIQEVGYRTRIQGIAQYLQVDGCIKNLADGRVKIVVQGSTEKVKDFISKIDIKDELISVDEVKVNYSDNFERFNGFNKIVGPNETDSRLDKAVIELKNVVDAIKETNQSIQHMHEDIKDMNQNMQSMHEDIKDMNQNMQAGFDKLDQNMHNNHVELVGEIHGLREDNNDKVMGEIQEVKALLKAHLKES
jgi:acylphosphatase